MATPKPEVGPAVPLAFASSAPPQATAILTTFVQKQLSHTLQTVDGDSIICVYVRPNTQSVDIRIAVTTCLRQYAPLAGLSIRKIGTQVFTYVSLGSIVFYWDNTAPGRIELVDELLNTRGAWTVATTTYELELVGRAMLSTNAICFDDVIRLGMKSQTPTDIPYAVFSSQFPQGFEAAHTPGLGGAIIAYCSGLFAATFKEGLIRLQTLPQSNRFTQGLISEFAALSAVQAPPIQDVPLARHFLATLVDRFKSWGANGDSTALGRRGPMEPAPLPTYASVVQKPI